MCTGEKKIDKCNGSKCLNKSIVTANMNEKMHEPTKRTNDALDTSENPFFPGKCETSLKSQNYVVIKFIYLFCVCVCVSVRD